MAKGKQVIFMFLLEVLMGREGAGLQSGPEFFFFIFIAFWVKQLSLAVTLHSLPRPLYNA